MVGHLIVAVTALVFVWLGYEIAVRRWRDDAGALEIWNAAFAIGSALWIASAWVAALLHMLDRPTMLLRTGAVIVAASLACWQRVRGRVVVPELDGGDVRRYLLPLLPVFMWIIFILWRSTVVPPASHDALAYHLPRAVLWIREHAFTFLDLPFDSRMRILPANYEILLADVILLDGGDAVTEWLGVFFYVGFVVAAGSLCERWWQRQNLATLSVVLLTASIPVLLLHTGADKNDIMTGFFMLSALTWSGRWLSLGDVGALILCGVTVISAAGTKPQGLMLAAAMFPFVMWRLVKELRARRVDFAALARVVAVAVLAAVLLGGAFFVTRAIHEGVAGAAERRAFVAYDDWSNLWQAPWVLLTAPFSPWSDELYVPWSDHHWFWVRHEIYFSHLGVPFAICFVLLPVAVMLFRNDVPERRNERHAMFLAAFATVLLMLPVRDVPMPHGVYTVALPRYVLFFAPVVFALVIAPATARLGTAARRLSAAVPVALALWFCAQAVDAGLNDRFVPLDYVVAARNAPGTRFIAFDSFRAASVVDRIAGPQDTIYFDAGYAAWIHPAFGADLRRPVKFLDAPVVPSDAKWIVIDRGFRIVWQHERFHDLGDTYRYLTRGSPTARDTSLINDLLRDPRFKPVFVDRRWNQAVFQRIR
jgi:hypothetical protein